MDNFASSLDDFLEFNETAQGAESMLEVLDRIKTQLPDSILDLPPHLPEAYAEELTVKLETFSVIIMQLVANLRAEADLIDEIERLENMVRMYEEGAANDTEIVERIGEGLVGKAIEKADERLKQYKETASFLYIAREGAVAYLTDHGSKLADDLEANL